QHVTLGDLLAEHLDEVDPQRDGVDVHEQEVAAKLPFQPIVHSASVTSAIVAAIADEDLTRHHQTPGGPNSKYYIIKWASPCTTLLRPHVSYFTFTPRMEAKLVAADDSPKPPSQKRQKTLKAHHTYHVSLL